MADKQTSKASPFTPSWDLVPVSFNLVRQHYVALIYLILMPGLVYALGTLLLSGGLQADGSLVLGAREKQGLAVAAVGLLWTIINLGPLTYFQAEATMRSTISLGEAYRKGLRFTLPLLGLSILFGLMILAGLILLIIPGLIIARRYILAPYYLVTEKQGVFAAFSHAGKDSKAAAGYIWGTIGVGLAFSFLSVFMQSVPLIGIIIGQLFTLVVTFLLALRFREVRARNATT